MHTYKSLDCAFIMKECHRKLAVNFFRFLVYFFVTLWFLYCYLLSVELNLLKWRRI